MMRGLQERQLVGLDALGAVTSLSQRVRSAHPTIGLFEAADHQWWWRAPRSTDLLGQLVWFDEGGRPEAAAITVDWGEYVSFVPILMPEAPPELVAEVLERGLAHAAESGIEAVELEVSEADGVVRELLVARGFVMSEAAFLVEAWLAADARPGVSSLSDGYRLTNRRDTLDRPHHNNLTGPELSARLLQTSLYRTDLDLLVVDRDDDPAAFGIFWHDPETATGLVEPMRTEDEHQRRGLARHVLTAGVDLLAEAGAKRIKICFEPGNPGSSHLYPDVGFESVKRTDLLAGPTTAP